MSKLASGKDKIQQICDSIRKETLEPIKEEAREILDHAHAQAADIVQKAKAEAEKIRSAAERDAEEKQRLLQASLQLACRQGVEWLKQRIEKELFNPELTQLVKHETEAPHLIAKIVESFMKSLEEKGIDEDFAVVIPKEITPRAINQLLAQKILDRLKNHSVEVGDFHGGVQIQMKNRQITIDISDKALRELIGAYIRRDFRDLIFLA